jgi:apolipoprotein N-acyltransferase
MTTGDVLMADEESKPPVSPRKRLPGLRLALLASLLLWLANPSLSLWPLAWVGVTPLLLSVTRATRFRQAFWRGYLFGCVYLGAVWYWIGLTINAWSNSLIAGFLAWFLLTLILSLYYGFWGGLAWWLSRRTTGLWRVVALAASWVFLEWFRTLGSLAMPWGQLSYTQYHFLPILQISELTGAYGVTFLILLVNAALLTWWEGKDSPQRTQRNTEENTEESTKDTKAHKEKSIEAGRQETRKPGINSSFILHPSSFAFAVSLVALSLLYGLVRMAMPEGGKPLTVAAMQGNFSAQVKRYPMETLQTVNALTEKAAQEAPPPALYVWGESTTHFAPQYLWIRQGYRDIARRYHAAVTVGSIVEDRAKVDGKEVPIKTNSAVLFPLEGEPQQYDKTQMVPFGEFVPFRPLIGSIMEQQFDFPNDDLVFGGHAETQVYTDPTAGRVSLGPYICYESMFPQMARAMTRQGANLLVTQSNDDWFQSDAAMEQHLSAVVLRTIENRRFTARATTTGVTCLLDSKGRILQRAPIHTPAYVVGTVQLLEGKTLYVLLGDWFVALCLGLILFAVWRNRVRKT